MRTIPFFSIALAAISLTTFAACGKEGDTTAPVIRLIEPAEEEAFELGGTLHLEMDLSDNEALDEYKVEIHQAAGHTHTRATEASIYTATWSDAKGLKSKEVRQDIPLPADAAPGDYHLMVYCTDASGNESHAVVTVELGTEPYEHEHAE